MLPVMPWQFSDEIDVYGVHVWDRLAIDPVRNTVLLTLIQNIRSGRQPPDGVMFAWYDGRASLGAVGFRPPNELIIAAMPEGTAGELVAALRHRRIPMTEVRGEVTTVASFVDRWTAGGTAQTATRLRMRLYALTTVRTPSPPPGRARLATAADEPLALQWYVAFEEEANLRRTDVSRRSRGAIAAGLLWLWEDAREQPVAMAGRHGPAAGVSRISPVYTLPEERGRGYGAVVTAACTDDALGRGAHHAVLFADLANPTSNAIYQRIGFTPVHDEHVVAFSR
jgi:predicted GNAT family acetyltransferase